MDELRPNGQRAKNAILLIWIIIAINIVAIISKFLQYNLLQTISNGGYVSPDEANANDNTERIIAVIYLIVYSTSGIVFIQWFRRAYYNLHLKVNYLSHGEGWAAGSWFTPFVNLYRPLEIMKELYNETKSYLTEKGINVDKNFTTGLLNLWWILWLFSNITGTMITRYFADATSLIELTNSTVMGIVDKVIEIIVALVAIKVIKDYSQIEPLLIKAEENEKQPQPEVALVEAN